jgi:hypothetical protein
MRINRETLMRVVRDTVGQRTKADRSVLSVYLCGSLLEDEFLLGGSTDIDLVIIHTDTVKPEREIVRLTDEIHLDIAHHFHRDYRQPRSLRVHPWQGPTIKYCKILHDPQHFLDFTQASVSGQFYQADFVMARARSQAEHARQMWSGFALERPDAGPKELATYLRAVDHAVNAVASLSGPPLTERRLLLHLPARAEAVGRPGLYAGTLGLLGAPRIDAEGLKALLPVWQAALESLGEVAPGRLHPHRLGYYRTGISALIDSPQPHNALWPLLHTWTLAANHYAEGAPEFASWQQTFNALGLLGSGFHERIDALDAYLDQVEETLESWAQANGASL